MYLLAFLDRYGKRGATFDIQLTRNLRVNIANANVFRMSNPDQLNLTGIKYNTALVIFFVPYVVFEIPSNLILKKLRPNWWLSGCMFMFGLTTITQGLVSNYSGLLTTRFFLGVFETGMFPGCA